MSLLEEARFMRQRVIDRLRELEPLVREYNELRSLATGDMGIGEQELPLAWDERPRSDGSATSARTPRRGKRRPTAARRRPVQPSAEGNISERALDAVRTRPGKTVAEYAAMLDMTPTALYRPVRELSKQGAIVKRARQLFPT
jgi:hypothetical protein